MSVYLHEFTTMCFTDCQGLYADAILECIAKVIVGFLVKDLSATERIDECCTTLRELGTI